MPSWETLAEKRIDLNSVLTDMTLTRTFYLNFYTRDSSDDNLYVRFVISNGVVGWVNADSIPPYPQMIVYQNGQWIDEKYRYIYIQGGNDTTDADALEWFGYNAVEATPPSYTITLHLTYLTYSIIIGNLTVQEGGQCQIQLIPDTNYGFPSSIEYTVTPDGTSTYTTQVSYDAELGRINVDTVGGDVDITAVGSFHRTYQISTFLENLTYLGDTEIETDGTAEGRLYASAGYYLPETISVTGCSYTYNKTTGIILFSNPPHSSQGVFLEAHGSEIDTSDLTLILYDNQSEKNRMIKNIVPIKSLSGVLREQSSILEPVITFQDVGAPTFNYVQIPNFRRFYFVKNIVSVSKDIWRVELMVDVLMTYSTLIFNLQCFVKRNEFDYNGLIADNLLPKSNDEMVTILTPYYQSQFDIYHDCYRYMVSSAGVYTGSWTPDWQYRKTFPCSDKYILNSTYLQILCNEFNGDNFQFANIFSNDPLEAVLSLRAYPFDIADLFNITSQGDVGIHISSWTSANAKGKWCAERADNQIGVRGGIFYITSNDWKDYEATYSIYVPYAGFYDLKGYQFLNKYLLIWYDVDYDTGAASVSFYATDTESVVRAQNMKPFASYPCQLAVNIPYSQTNVREQVKAAFDAIATGGLALAVAASGGALAPAAAGATALTLAGKLDKMKEHVTRGGTNASSWLGNFIGKECFIIKTAFHYYTPTNYGHLFGYPLNATRTLSNVHGFTQVSEVHLEDMTMAMVEECEEIGRLLKEGVILP